MLLKRHSVGTFGLALLALAGAVAIRAEEPAKAQPPTDTAASTQPATQPASDQRRRSPDGTGKWYMGREIARVMGHQGAAWLERPEREEEERPSRLIEILKKRIKPTDVFADI